VRNRLLRSCRLLALVALAMGWRVQARAQACNEELRALQDLRQEMRSEVIAGNMTAAVATASKQKLEPPVGYDYEQSSSCQRWALEVAYVHRASCSFDLARKQLQSIRTEQPLAADTVRRALERVSHPSVVPFACTDRKNLYLICQPASDSVPDAWCARRIEQDKTLEVPRDAWCKVVDEDGVELSTISEGSDVSCREDLRSQKRAERDRALAEGRSTIAGAGTSIALLAAVLVPFSFVPEGFAKLVRRLGALDKHGGERLRHRSFRARQRVLPLLGVNALAVSALSSRFWWAGILTTGCSTTADVMLAQNWHHHDKTRRAIGIAAATVGASAGLVLNLETLSYGDTGPRYAFMPTLSFGVAGAELGLVGRF
jgi:hypothetical protein